MACAVGSGTLYVMRSDDRISDWEGQLVTNVGQFRLFRKNDPPANFAHTPGALYNMAHMWAYVLGARWVVVDTGPGSGPLFMNVVMSSHGFIVPCGIEQKTKSLLASLAEKVWCGGALHMYACACLPACLPVCTCVHVDKCTRACIACTRARAHTPHTPAPQISLTHGRTCAHTHIHIHIHMHIHMHAHATHWLCATTPHPHRPFPPRSPRGPTWATRTRTTAFGAT